MLVLRAVIIFAFVLAGYLAGGKYGNATFGIFAGLLVGVWAGIFEALIRQARFNSILGGIMGVWAGFILAELLLVPFRHYELPYEREVFLSLCLILGTVGLMTGLERGRRFKLASFIRKLRGGDDSENIKLLDTSVIIDGRIADICETSFLDGVFVAPQFILHELQHIADSPDSLKRARGRRGLDILQRMQKMHQITVRIVEDDFPKIKEVDSKLVALAKVMDAKVITNDFNLNKVAELQGVTVLNINELANAIKPLVLPGEPLRVFVVKEGKEQNQGVAYLEDGTMVVVDNGRKQIGKNIDVTVTSVLQTTAGRMIFTKTREDYERDEGRQGNSR
jgi:uncharacterized protein YacL